MESGDLKSEINDNDVDENKINQLSSISAFESNRDNKTNLDNIGNDKIYIEYENYDNVEDENESNKNLLVLRKSNTKKSPVSRYGNPVTHFIYVNYIDANVQNTFEKAINSREYK